MRRTLLLLPALLLMASPCMFACSITQALQKTQATFTVAVHDSLGRAVPQLPVRLRPVGETDVKEIESRTDKSGTVRFSNVPVGRWDLSSGDIGFSTDSFAALIVASDTDGVDSLELTWPDAVNVVEALKGRVNFKDSYFDQGRFKEREITLSDVHLQLTTWWSDKVVTSADADSAGYYSFENLKPGKYLLHVEYSIVRGKEKAVIPIEINPGDWHALERLDITLSTPMCGPWAYTVNS